MQQFSPLVARGPSADVVKLEASQGSPAKEAVTPRYWSRRARQALVAAVSQHSSAAGPALSSLVARCEEDELVALAISEGVAGPAGETLGPLLSPDSHSRLRTVARQQAARNLAHLAWLRKFGSALESADITWVVLKGPVLAEVSYRGSTRGYADLDLLVPARHLANAVETLKAAGATVFDQDWSWLVQSGKGELTMAVHGSPLIDLHWHLVYHRSARERFRITTDELLERRVKTRLRIVDAWALDPTDFAAHVALHASFQGAQRLRRLLDIERTIANQPPDWDALVTRCLNWRVAFPVGVLLESARQTLGAAVPDGVVRQLARGPVERLVARQLGGWLPSGLMPGGRSVKTGLSRSLRDSPLATAAQFADEARRAAGALVPTLTNPGRRRGPHNTIGTNGLQQFIHMANSADRYGHLEGRRLHDLALAR